jgi:hypothetical protein
MPVPMVFATSVPKKAPIVLQIVAIITAVLGFMTRVDTMVAIELGASVHPLTNSDAKISAKTTKRAELIIYFLRNPDIY